MQRDKWDKIMIECYTKLYAVSNPPADFVKLLDNTEKPCGFEKKTDIDFMAHSINQDVCHRIIDEISKKYNFNEYEKLAFRNSILLGLCPKYDSE
jgi:hypothetical protein